MTDSIRDQIISAIVTRLGGILATNGYQTDCGDNVQLVRPKLDPAELPACVVWPGVEEADRQIGSGKLTLPIQVDLLSLHGDENPSEVAGRMLADVIERMTGAVWTWAFTVGTAEISAGDTLTGATSAATAHVEAVTVSSGSWAGGDAAGTLTLRRLSGTTPTSGENLKLSGSVACTMTGLPSGQSTITAMGGLIDEIHYAEGGVSTWPQPGDTVTAVMARFDIKYRTMAGNPYAQPA